ncbi:MAG: aldo/keto reductase [Gammaproteobacteria bacterium]
MGELVDEIGNRDKLFLATKVTAQDDDLAKGSAMLEESFRRLRTKRIDLMQVHNLTGAEELIPVLQKWKADKRIRYTGVTTSNDEQYPQMLALMRRHLFAQLANRPLPDWAAEIDAASWPQVLLKYVVSHPAVTCAIPGTTKLSHLEDNQGAARGPLPDAALRKKMEAYWDANA